MKNISLEVDEVSYSGVVYFNATLNIDIHKEKGQLLLRYQFK